MNSKRGLSSAFAEEGFNLREALGGPRGVVESLAPTFVFLTVFLTMRDAAVAGVAALIVVIVLVAARLIQGQPLGPVIGGAIIVAIGAFAAIRSGDGTGFYAPGLITNAVWASVLVVSVVVRRPLVGFAAAAMDERVKAWRDVPRATRMYTWATAVYTGLFAAKVAVQAPLYFLGYTDALGVAKLIMGLPLFAAVTYVIYLIHRRTVRILEES